MRAINGEFQLDNMELETISKLVSSRLHQRIMEDAVHQELKKANEEYTKIMIDFYLSENAISSGAEKVIKPILDAHLKQTNIVEEHLQRYLNSDNFKKIELSHLRERVKQLEREIYEEDYE